MFQETMGSRIKQKREELGLSQEELGRKLKGKNSEKVTHTSISKWESDLSQPQSSNLMQLSKIFNCSIEWLISGLGVDNFQDDNFRATKIHFVDDTNILNATFSKNKEYVLTERTDISIKSFAYPIQDNSMMPVFLENDVVIIDTARQPEKENFVLARISDTVLIRRFIVDELVQDVQHFSVVPLNQDYTVFSTHNNKIEILGTVIEHRSRRVK